jgi:hypothetical protein
MNRNAHHSAPENASIRQEEVALMELTNIEKYLTSLAPITSLFNSEQITPDEYIKAESFLAKKYCIKDDDIHRPNHLIIKGFRAMYMYGKKEEKHGKEDNPNRRVTAIEKKA